MDKLFLLDAYALIYRAYYALIKSPRINSKGFNTSAILGFVNTLEDVLKKESPTHIGVAFDPSGPTFRHEAYKEYKAQREETPEAIRLSVPIIKDIIRAYKIPILEVPGYEADDVIGTLATEAGKRGITTYMMTPDKDYGQLVSENVFMYRPKYGDKEFDIMGIEEVKAKFNIESTSQVIDMLGLMGDSSDNIPGCPGVGEKTAQKLISEFGSIENLLEHTDQLKGAIKTKVESNVEKIKFSKFLATIKTDVPIELDMDSLKRETPDEEKLRSIFEELEFRTLLERVFKSDKKPAAKQAPEKQALQGDLFGFFADDNTEEQKNSSLKRLEDTDYDYQLIDTEDKINDFLRIILTKEIISLDTETTGTNAMSAELVGMSFSYKENQAFYVPVPQDREEAQKIVDKFKPVFENEKSIKVGQNIKYDMIVLGNYGVSIKGQMFDTMIAHYVLQPELHHGMDYLAEVYLKYDTIKIEELIGAKGKNQRNMRDLSPTDIYKYACEDADVTLKLKNILEKELETNGVKELFEEIEMPLVPVLAYIERNGVRIDTEALKETSRHFTIRMREIEEEIYKLAGMEFNVSSPKQVGEVLFDRLKIVEKAKKTKTGQYVTSEEVLESLKGKHQIVEKILDYRGLKKLLSTYIDALPELINPKTGRIHTSFNQTVTATGRLSSSNPNLQNIPVRDDDGKEIRKAFIPDDGCEFFSADYSQIELRIMAHLSEDDNMIEAFREEQDIHAATAAKIYKINIDEVTREQRSKAKTANFGIIYGISVFGLAERLNVDRKEAKELIDGYFENYPKVKAYMDESIRSARDKGYIETIFKRKRYLPDINSRNAVVRGYAERNAINAPIQGSAADIIKVAMIRIYKRFMDEGIKSKMILQVHDELNFSVLREEKEKVQQIVISEMEAAYKMKVPLLADCGWGQNWLEAH
ncbi:DNA polymerase I [uncultured Bacteroides sp.]|uniref:DNA polymerase I n=1 Tax=Bacteroides cellulolyticus TaxID=2981780 RepID=UPI000820D3FE|nr:DNA polymerase I [Bacteroides cellulolyticus]MCU6772572.1 DNA polymerase I [Bacteroides cellulolyticus]SCI46706.1 DNA polymerase I [uncultured Bacteroides sp.]